MPFKKRFPWKQSIFDNGALIHSPIRLRMHIMTNLSSIKIVYYPKNELAESIYSSWRFPEETGAAAWAASAAWTVKTPHLMQAMRPPLVSPGSKKWTLVGNWGRRLLMGAMVLLRQNQKSYVTIRTGKAAQSWKCVIVNNNTNPKKARWERKQLLFPMGHAPLTTWTSWTSV